MFIEGCYTGVTKTNKKKPKIKDPDESLRLSINNPFGYHIINKDSHAPTAALRLRTITRLSTLSVFHSFFLLRTNESETTDLIDNPLLSSLSHHEYFLM